MTPFVTAHTFCVSRDGPRKLGFFAAMPAKTDSFARFITTREKQILAMGYWNPKRKVGATVHFFEIIKL